MMFFFSQIVYISSDKSNPVNMTKNTSLQTYPIENLSNTSYNTHHDNVNRKKRTLPFIFRNNNGSMTLEAALVLPIFLIFMLQLLSAINILKITMDIESAMHQTTKKMALYAYAYERVIPIDNEILKELSSFALSSGYAKTDVITTVGKKYLDNSLIKEGSNGISFLLSEVMKEDKINLIATYQIVPAFSILPFSTMTMVQRCQMKAWTGYDNLSNQSTEQTKYVYVTKTGTVYHENRNCTHLLLSIETCLAMEIVNKRNADGNIYQSCELCWEKKDEINSTVLITKEGNRYHSSLDCSGLKRTITTIPYSEIGNLKPCSRCSTQ